MKLKKNETGQYLDCNMEKTWEDNSAKLCLIFCAMEPDKENVHLDWTTNHVVICWQQRKLIYWKSNLIFSL